MRIRHLAGRFVRALWPQPPAAAEEAWAAGALEPSELLLFRRLPDHDRRHAIRVARRVARGLGPEARRGPWVAVALLHDVGKYDAGLSVPGRAIATVVLAVTAPSRRDRWAARGTGLRGRIAVYARHGELGAAEIRRAGGREEAARWSAAHHHPETWPTLAIPPEVVRILDAADNQ